ncbi:hypothetical protein [Aureimonas ureilytica]|uniref:hypothetical protein n=1 Tax=Aureimonas ureilytica TaxID=401562 RepID=UPI00036D51D9|nr:hypothetical protein [Aureimonas ureilytica]
MSRNATQFPLIESFPGHESILQDDRASSARLVRWLISYTALAAGIIAFMLLSLIPTERHAATTAKVDQERFSSFRTAGVAQ